ncbi:MAG: metallophosphoesterase [Deltaproteobacteria bacterium]|nr:metallophosphoesterase [Deltaproteobacteria bacterium]MBW2397269.1 metallophosphoesterase [Deltaproteobacteria bacterium]
MVRIVFVVLGLAALGCELAGMDKGRMSETIPGSATNLEQEGPQPWNHLDFQNRPEDFTFAIVSDLTGGYRPGVFPAAVERLNLLRPEFVVSVGDLIEGYTEDRAVLTSEWDAFDAMLAPLHAPFFYAAGNHDYSNPVMADVWKERLGRDYYHLLYRNVLFLVLNTEKKQFPLPPELARKLGRVRALQKTDPAAAKKLAAALGRSVNWVGDMPAELGEEQIAYFEQVIAAHPEVRHTFLLMHKPIWQGAGNDGLRRIEAALGERPFTAFAGHVHNYHRFEIDGRVHIRLGTTGGEWLVPGTTGNFDHLVLVTMTEEGPSIANLLLDGILDDRGRINDNDRLWRARAD